MNNIVTAASKRKRAHFYLYKKQKRLQNVYIYKNRETFQKARQFDLRFYKQKSKTLIFTRFFMKFLKLIFTIKKPSHYALLKILYTKSQTLRKNQDNLH